MSPTSISDACLSPDALSAWVEGKLDDEARRRALAHASRCAACREASSLLAALHPVDVVDASQTETPADGSDDDRSVLPAPGSRLGRFRVEKVIGKGGMGLVLRARDERLARDVAIKVVSGPKNDALAARLASEARALAALTHPNLVTVYEAGEHAGRFYLVMELIDGENLRVHIATKRPSWRVGLALCLAAGRGLAALHAAGFVHRDVKPDNVLIAKDGRVLLADLGLAKRLDSGPNAAGTFENAPLTRTGAIVGTPRYLAPERVAGQPGDVRSDVYGFAAMTLEIVRGCEGDVPRRVVALLSKGLDPDPAMRFGSIDELSRSVGGAARSRRLPVALAGGVLVALATVAAARGGVSDSGSSRAPTPSEPDRASGSASAVPVAFTTGSAEPPLPFAAAEPSADPLADALPTASSAPRVTAARAAPVDSPSASSAPRAAAARAAPVASPMGWPPFAPAPGASQSVKFDPALTLSRAIEGLHPLTTARGLQSMGQHKCAGEKEANDSPLGVDWGKVERRGYAEVEDNSGEKRPWLLYQVAGWQKRWLFGGVLESRFLDVAVGDWVFVCPSEKTAKEKTPEGWQGKLVNTIAFGPIAGPPAFWSRKPRPHYADHIHLVAADDRGATMWPFGEGPLLFSISSPPKSFIAEGRVDMGIYFLELTSSTKGAEALKSATNERWAWVIAKFSGYQNRRGTDYPVLRVDEVLSSLFESPPAKPATNP